MSQEESIISEVDAKGMSCPLPLLKAKQALNRMQMGQELIVWATDAGSVRDFAIFAEQSGNPLLESSEEDGVYRYLIRKGP